MSCRTRIPAHGAHPSEQPGPATAGLFVCPSLAHVPQCHLGLVRAVQTFSAQCSSQGLNRLGCSLAVYWQGSREVSTEYWSVGSSPGSCALSCRTARG